MGLAALIVIFSDIYTEHMKVTILAVGLFLFLVPTGCRRDTDTTGSVRSEVLVPFKVSVSEARSLTLFEGLPHQFWEAEELKKELSQKPTVQLHGFPFYEQTLAVEPRDASKLKVLFLSAETFQLYPAGVVHVKQCGGFHPDYVVRWTTGDRVYDVLICFGCEEARCYGPCREVYCDISPAALKEFESTLTPYRRSRPLKQ